MNNTQNIVQRIESYLNHYMVFPDPMQATACALWALHTWTFSESFPMTPYTTPYLRITSKGPRSGKTLLIDLLEPIVLNPERTINMTSSVMFRLIEHVHPTLFIDEVDTVFDGKRNSDLQNVINGGYKHSGYVWRTVPDKNGPKPMKFHTFSPKLLAGIDNGKLPETVTSRSIEIELERVTTIDEEGNLIAPDGTTREVYYSFVAEPEAEALVSEIEAFIAAWKADYQPYTPKPIAGINPRAWEIAFPLIQVAHRAGIEQEARKVLAYMLAPKPEKESPEVVSLRIIRELFEHTAADKLHSATIAEALGEGWNGKLVATRLGHFIEGGSATFNVGNRAAKGYYKHQFTKAWAANL